MAVSVPFTLMTDVAGETMGKTVVFSDVQHRVPRGILSRFTIYSTMGGIPTAVTLNILGSIDRSNWFILASHVFDSTEISDKKSMFHIINKPVMFMQAQTKKLQGTTPSITIRAIGQE